MPAGAWGGCRGDAFPSEHRSSWQPHSCIIPGLQAKHPADGILELILGLQWPQGGCALAGMRGFWLHSGRGVWWECLSPSKDKGSQ